MLDVGASIPDFSLKASDGRVVTAEGLRGQRYVLYFYPKDDTPGCTKEACGFRDQMPRFDGIRVPVFGVSADTDASHQKFAAKYQLNFPLLADPELTLLKALGVWVQKSMYGKTYMGVARATFVVDAEGRIEKVWAKVSPEGHAEEVLAYLGVKAGPAKTVEKQATSAKKAASARKAAPAKVAAAAKKAPAKKAAAAGKTAAAKKTSVKKATPAKKASVKKATAKKAAPASKARR
ncbi:thioredoxin-dependent thiol peroxidase [Silanimonas lenta]|jgi:peroxiredoxin Q/BCP|uniref:thioredoxin-dependent thiol peroxidase n=1 Tax=Silanimonas lenta TaxID=265429 RepID=UPI002FE38912